MTGSPVEHLALQSSSSIEIKNLHTSDSNLSFGYSIHSEDEEQLPSDSTNANTPQLIAKAHHADEPSSGCLHIADAAMDLDNDDHLSATVERPEPEYDLGNFVETADRYNITRKVASYCSLRELPHSSSHTSTESIEDFNIVAHQMSTGKDGTGVDVDATCMSDGSTAELAVAPKQHDADYHAQRRCAQHKCSAKVRKSPATSPRGTANKERPRNYYSKERVDITLRPVQPLIALGLPGTKGTLMMKEPALCDTTTAPTNPDGAEPKADDTSSSDQDKGAVIIDVISAAAKLKGIRGKFKYYGRRKRDCYFGGAESGPFFHKASDKDSQLEALQKLRFCRLYTPIPTQVLEGEDEVSTDIVMTGSLADHQFDPDCCDVDTSGIEVTDRAGTANTVFISKCHLTYNAVGEPCWCCCYIDFFNVFAQKRFDVDAFGYELAEALAERCKENAETLFHMLWIQQNRHSLERCIPTDASISVLQRFVQIKHAVLRVDRMGLFAAQMRQVVKL
ncbi:hypothetical protein, conserved [Babesia bigemina]|uniref:Uncharacterized protein n=1 Tax=Babesia bigemina TaxID=5866 RepID=A0A061D0B8_BABBI|nr:hypothetical protein, conserved [Babesia bigemina]CDR94118.1 hypothetical protein, conserved [Babesia bigemina]|eukprot:XP_012766304.1 hypothetical protein, conserved [Babesia bigemina]